MSKWEVNVRAVTPYVPGEQPKVQNIIKLNTNENPYPPSPAVRAQLAAMNYETLRLYPDPDASVLTAAIAKYYGVTKSQVFVGVGSDDVLSMAYMTFFNGEKPLVFPDITYSFYDVWANVHRIPYQCIPLNEKFEIVAEDYVKAAGTVGGIIFPNPNAPTGVAMTIEQIEAIVQANQDVVVIVDEAYVDFGAESALPLVKKYDNVLVVQTFSKSRAMAGIRIGYAIGNEKLISYMNAVKESVNSYTMNQPALEVGAAAIEDDAYFRDCCNKIIQTRERVKSELAKLGFVFPDSKTNFIFAHHPLVEAKEIFAALRKENIFVRYFNKPVIDQYLRITIGIDDEMDKMLEFLKKYLA